MKRSFSLFDASQESAAGGTPRNMIPRPANGLRNTQHHQSSKRARQTSLRAFMNLDTPTLSAAGPPAGMDTPVLMAPHNPVAVEAPNPNGDFTVTRAIAQLRVNTPSLPCSLGPHIPVNPSLAVPEDDDNSRQYADTCMHPGLHPLASSAAPLSSLPSLSAGLGLGLGLVSGDATEPSRDYDPNQLFERDAPDHEDLTLPSHAGSHRSHHASHKANEDVEEEEDPMEDIGFRIMSSQTYMRHTQQDSADERSVSWHEDWPRGGGGGEPSLRGACGGEPSFHGHVPSFLSAPEAAAGPSQPHAWAGAAHDASQQTFFGQGLAMRARHAPHGHAHGGPLSLAMGRREDHSQATRELSQIPHRLTPPSQPAGVASQAAAADPARGAADAADDCEDDDCAPCASQPPTAPQPAASDQALTPELMPVASSMCSDGTHPTSGGGCAPPAAGAVHKPLAALFRPKAERKLLMIIRHGESEYNLACSKSRDYADPQIFDPKLTTTGINQCARLREKLSSLLPKHTAQYGEPLWVMSPLTRALQTFLLSCPYPERVHAAQPSLTNITNMTQQPFGAAGGSTGAASSGTQGGVAPLHIEIHPGISEFLVTPGDVGRPASKLMEDFPQLAGRLSTLPEVWWHRTGAKVSCALTRRFEAAEPKKQRRQRVQEFARWLESRPERLFVLIGHSCFWKEFMGNHYDKSLRNCELFCMPY